MQKTFNEVSESWCAIKRQIVKQSTMLGYLLTLKKHLLPYFGTKTYITEVEVQQFVFYKFSCGLARKTIKDIVAVLKAVSKYGKRHKIFQYEDWEIQYPTLNTEVRRLPTLTITHQRRLMRYLIENPTAQNIGVMLALSTGMRMGEVCALQWGDVDFCQRIITVRRTVERVYNCERKATERMF